MHGFLVDGHIRHLYTPSLHVLLLSPIQSNTKFTSTWQDCSCLMVYMCRVNDQLSDTSIIWTPISEKMEIATIVSLARGCSPTHVMLANQMGHGSSGRCCVFVIFHQKHQCLKTAIVGQNDQFLDSTYHRRPEAGPDIESGLQGCLFVPLTIEYM